MTCGGERRLAPRSLEQSPIPGFLCVCQRVINDNGSCYKSMLWWQAAPPHDHRDADPCRPQTRARHARWLHRSTHNSGPLRARWKRASAAVRLLVGSEGRPGTRCAQTWEASRSSASTRRANEHAAHPAPTRHRVASI